MKISLSIIAIVAISFWAYVSLKREADRRGILELRCGRRDNIKFRLNSTNFNQRIYLSVEECSELSSQETIGVKIDSKGNVVFANANYNDWSEGESVAIVLLSLFFMSMIVYYGVLPEIKIRRPRETKKKKKNKKKKTRGK